VSELNPNIGEVDFRIDRLEITPNLYDIALSLLAMIIAQ
jgi:hypothetical protein